MGECFWSQESVIGLTKDCPPPPLSTSLWAYIDIVPESWTPRAGGNYQLPGFPLDGSLAGVTAATLTGVKTARADRVGAGGDTGVFVYSTDAPTTVAYAPTNIAAASELRFDGLWMFAQEWPSPPLDPRDAYAVVACRWDTNLGILYTLSYLSSGV